MSSAARQPPVSAPAPARATSWALAAGAALGLLGAVSATPMLGLVAAGLLWLAWMPRVAAMRGVVPWLVWFGLAALLALPATLGHAALALSMLPVLILSAVAWWFARSLRAGAEPLVVRCVRLLEGDARLAMPGVRAYARGVTVFWVGLPALLALACLLLALFAPPGGRWAVWFPGWGCGLSLLLAFVGEYGFRRWKLRGMPHLGPLSFAVGLVRCWPELLRAEERRA